MAVPPLRGGLVIGAATLLLLAGLLGYLWVPRHSGVVVVVKGLNRVGAVYGTVQLIPSGPGGIGRIVTIEYHGGPRVVAVASPPPPGSGGGDAAALTVVLNLYTREGRLLLASKVYTGYDAALRRLHDPVKAYRAVEEDPYYLYHHVHVIAVDAASLLQAVGNNTGETQSASPPLTAKPYGGAAPEVWVPSTCYDVITVDNLYLFRENLGLQIDESSLLTVPDFYHAQMPPEFAQHVHGASPAKVYNVFRHRLPTAVLVPRACGDPVGASVYNWYHVPPGFYEMGDFLSRLSGAHVSWTPSHPEDKEILGYKPIAFIEASCGHNCEDDRVELKLIMGSARFTHYVNGISIAGYVIGAHEDAVNVIRVASEVITTLRAKQNCMAYILAYIKRTYLGDGVYIKYIIEPVEVYSTRLGRYLDFWLVKPLPLFTPIVHDKIIKPPLGKPLKGVLACPDTDRERYEALLNEVFNELGEGGYTEVKIYDKTITDFSLLDDEVVDSSTAQRVFSTGTLAGALYKLGAQSIKQLITILIPKAVTSNPWVKAALAYVNYAYTDVHLSATKVELDRSNKPQPGRQVHVVVYKITTLDHPADWAPLLMGYEAEFNPTHTGPPSPPHYLPTEKNSGG